MLERAVWLVPLLPWLAAAGIAVCALRGRRGDASERIPAQLALWASAAALILLLLIDARALWGRFPGQVRLIPWLESGSYRIWISFTLDALGLGLATLAALAGLLTVRFSVAYLHREAGFQRFFLVLCLFNGAMSLILLAGNVALTFMGWELAGVSSYLLIGYALDRPIPGDNATAAFVTNRVGDVGFVLGIYLAFAWLSGIEWPQILTEASGLSLNLIVAGFLLAALAKSAVLPFSSWITGALEGPTPSSALFYGAIMVHAGLYLVLRLEPLLHQAPVLMALIAVLGFLTAIYGSLVGLTQTDVKSSLMFATTAQVGLMFFLCGLGYFTLAAWYLAAHALWRLHQFLAAPGLMQGLEPARPVPRWLSRWPWLYTASLQRFWLETLSDGLLVRPTRGMARDLHTFDEEVMSRIIGHPEQDSTIHSLVQWETYRGAVLPGRIAGRGMAGRLLQWLAQQLARLEERLLLARGGAALKARVQAIGEVLTRIEELLSQPRYLFFMVMVTFVVILR
ncbi:MAG: proton-conducting transporter membrane subunit [Pseudomonadota bacterium]